MVRRGPGPKCSSSSSAAQSYSTGLRASCPYHETSTVVAVHGSVAWLVAVCSVLAGIACSCAQHVHAVSRLVFVLRRIFELLVVGVIWLLSGLFAAGVQFLYGGEDDEAIRFMEPEPVQEPVATSTPDRGRELEVLQNIIGVSGASYFGVEGHSSKQFGLQLYVRRDPDAERSKIRVACAGDKPTQVHAACAAKRRVAAILGDVAVEEAERLVSERRAAAGPSGRPAGCRCMQAPPPTEL